MFGKGLTEIVKSMLEKSMLLAPNPTLLFDLF